ncbi:MAG TPA: tyrosine-type recombinase/integrase [Candidatus Binatia bacterium]|nr:tyrosine-type recombinase/integrase [Candidatus Binatia bacterium]
MRKRRRVNMKGEMVPVTDRVVVLGDRQGPPALITAAGKAAAFAYAEFFGAEIESPHTYRAYRAAVDRFLAWCAERGVALTQVSPVVVGEYIRKQLVGSKPTKKLHLSALRHFFDQLVLRHAILLNPAASVRAPKYSVVEGKTPALSVEQVRRVLATIDTSHVVGLRDRAIIAILIYTAARVGAVAKLRLEDYAPDGNQWWFRFDEKGGKARTIPARYDLQSYVETYLAAAGIARDPGETPLFRSAVRKTKVLTPLPMTANDIYRMVKRRLQDAGLPARQLSCHSFRATTITDLLTQGVPLEDVQYLAGHADPRTTRLYDRRQKQVTRNIVERISV